MSDIFISYAKEDRAHAEAIASALTAQGWSVWWDRSIRAGGHIASVIERELDQARCVVVLWSAVSVKRDWVTDEAREGKERGVLVPVLIEEVRQPLGFRSLYAADLIAWGRDAGAPAFVRLCADIAELIGKPLAVGGDPVVAAGPAPSVDSEDGYVWIPPGEFWMGAVPGDEEAADHEKPRHRVKISKGFWLGATPVTVAEYKRFDGSRSGNHDHPVVNVIWEKAQAYCKWAGGRLPTEAEWEYAARGGKDGLKYPWGNEIKPEDANYSGSKWNGTSPVRSYPANDWGLYDMAGNVWEWVADWYDENYYKASPKNDPRGPDQETGVRVLRGGSFINVAENLRAAYRNWSGPGVRFNDVGFRCVREVIP